MNEETVFQKRCDERGCSKGLDKVFCLVFLGTVSFGLTEVFMKQHEMNLKDDRKEIDINFQD